MKYPDLPTKIMGMAGPITIRMRTARATIREDKDTWGTWDESTRMIDVDAGATKAHQWRILYHELAHSMLADSGIENMFADNIIETICDAVASARMRERFG